jgi:hypothetical protein
MKLAGMLQGTGVSINIDKPGEGHSDGDIAVRIKADAPVLWPMSQCLHLRCLRRIGQYNCRLTWHFRVLTLI